MTFREDHEDVWGVNSQLWWGILGLSVNLGFRADVCL